MNAFKIFLVILALVITIALLFLVNAFVGNPISKLLAQNAAEQYIAEQYNDRDFQIETVKYDFKGSNYKVRVVSPSSQDTHFSVSVSMTGKIGYDSYESVLNGWNTYQRIEQEYRKLVDTLLDSENFSIESDIAYGSIKITEQESVVGVGVNYGIDPSKLILDYNYDIKKIGKTAGEIVFYAIDDVITIERASQLILQLRQEFDQAGIPFYGLDFVLEKPKTTSEPRLDSEQIYIQNFPYSDIYEEGLYDRVQTAYGELQAYYKEQDSKRENR